jgi:probable F420-dependent oxidoreductase
MTPQPGTTPPESTPAPNASDPQGPGPRLGVTFASFQALGMDAGLSVARQAATLGYRSFWTAETTGAEAFVTLAATGAAAPGLDLGTGVLALQLRTPPLAAMGAATLASLHPERDVLLGVGISSPVVASRWHGAPWGTRPLSQVREYLELVRACLSGETVRHAGEHYQVDRFRLGVRLGERRPRLVLGALNQRMLRLAGELADGVLLNYLPATAVPWCVEQVRAGESAAGRPPGSCTIYAYVHVGVCERPDGIDAARRDLFSYVVVDAYADAFRRAGFAEEVEAVRSAHGRGDRDAALAAVSDRMVDAIDIMGDANHVAASVRAYLDAGVDEAVVMPLPWGPDRMAVIEATLAAATLA